MLAQIIVILAIVVLIVLVIKFIKHMIITFIVLGVIILIIAGLYSYFSAERVNARMDAANHCETDSDCVLVSYGCPFYSSYMNSRSEENVNFSVSMYMRLRPWMRYARCAQKPPADPVCQNQTCVERICEPGISYDDKFYCKCPEGTMPKYAESAMTCTITG